MSMPTYASSGMTARGMEKVLNSGRQVALNLADLGAILVCVDINEDTAR